METGLYPTSPKRHKRSILNISRSKGKQMFSVAQLVACVCVCNIYLNHAFQETKSRQTNFKDVTKSQAIQKKPKE